MTPKYPIHDVDDEHGRLVAEWLHGGDPLPLARHLLQQDNMMRLAVFCDIALADADDPAVRAELLAIRAQTTNAPDGWLASLEDFAQNPSVEAWNELLRFVPEEDWYLRVRDALPRLIDLGVDPDLVFHLATTDGKMSYGIELAETGLASPEVILERGIGSPCEGMWKALAAHSAAARGDQSRAVHLANQALALRRDAMEAFLVETNVQRLLDELDDDHRAAVLFSG